MKHQPKYPYPFIECSHHEGRQRAYAACQHVVSGQAKPLVVVLASDMEMGDLYCAECAELPKTEKDLDGYAPICEGCAIDRGLLLPIETEAA